MPIGLPTVPARRAPVIGNIKFSTAAPDPSAGSTAGVWPGNDGRVELRVLNPSTVPIYVAPTSAVSSVLSTATDSWVISSGGGTFTDGYSTTQWCFKSSAAATVPILRVIEWR